MKQYKSGIFALSADPVTFGHIDMIKKALLQCENLIIFVANNGAKKYLFNLKERYYMVKKTIKQFDIRNVQVIYGPELLTDMFLKYDCDVVFRGVRDEKDYKFESEQIFAMNLILPGFADKVVYIQSSVELKHVSSTLVKSFVQCHLPVSEMVPLFISAKLEERINRQFKVSFTGEICSGKSYVANAVKQYIETHYNIEVNYINLDQIIRDLYVEDSPSAQKIRDWILEHFGADTLSTDRKSVNLEILKSRMFSMSDDLKREAQQITAPHVTRLYRDALSDKEGIIILEWAKLAEMGMSTWTNNNAVLVHSSEGDKMSKKRGLDEKFAAAARKFQWNKAQKQQSLEKSIAREGSGQLIVFENNFDNDEAIKTLSISVVNLFKSSGKAGGH
jgi:pantetheine-phosphate adenylyltransferase